MAQIIIKEIAYGKTCVLRADTYNCTFAHFARLFAEAQRDFPDLDPAKVEIVQYGGRVSAHTFGIEFDAPFAGLLGYKPIERLEAKL